MSPAGRAATIALFAKTWGQIPTGSLPNNDSIVEAFSGTKDWHRIRVEVLRGWYLCADDRVYHADLAGWVLAALERHLQYKDRRETDKNRLRAWRKNRGLTESQWARLRVHVFQRDDNQCVQCGRPDDLHCDYIIDAADGGSSEPANLHTLCASCHGQKIGVVNSRYDREMRFNMVTTSVTTSPPTFLLSNPGKERRLSKKEGDFLNPDFEDEA